MGSTAGVWVQPRHGGSSRSGKGQGQKKPGGQGQEWFLQQGWGPEGIHLGIAQ